MINKNVEKLLLKVQKPGRYVGGEKNSVIKDKSKVDLRFAFRFPDVYEVGMSHLGMKILYSLFNSKENIWCERVFAPWIDMEELMVKNNIPLFALESGDPLTKFDFIGFTLQYELSFSKQTPPFHLLAPQLLHFWRQFNVVSELYAFLHSLIKNSLVTP